MNFVGFDIVEVLPAFDHGEITAYLAANIVFEFLSILALQKKQKEDSKASSLGGRNRKGGLHGVKHIPEKARSL